ncbi:hypothetical protein X754_00730 [Mesorhizobium sp. LNJC403B00]|nr:hypothetical protein X756_28700 [Mesorhizobium sp. LSHC412B00]ESX97269.1 hypothetical protein X754_00730 [Mesorhizobium sp. LNJC403B00]
MRARFRNAAQAPIGSIGTPSTQSPKMPIPEEQPCGGAGYALSAALDRSWRVAIAEVAYLAGFSDQGHLATAMKKHKGMKPWFGR